MPVLEQERKEVNRPSKSGKPSQTVETLLNHLLSLFPTYASGLTFARIDASLCFIAFKSAANQGVKVELVSSSTS